MDLVQFDSTSTVTRIPTAASPTAPALADVCGEVIAGRYRVRGRIALGGSAEVLVADDLVLRRAIAIKRPRGDRPYALAGGLGREARILARLRHPGVVCLHDHVIDGGLEHLVLEHIPGATMAGLRGTAMAPGAVARVGCAVAEALDHVHARGVLHLDVKAENVVLDQAAPRLIDFGISECDGEDPVPGEGLLGTPRSMAPEQIRGEPVDARTDLFALGVLLYELLTGTSPFLGDSVEAVLAEVLTTAPAPLAARAPRCPARLVDLVQHLLEKEPALRPPCAAEVAARLADIWG